MSRVDELIKIVEDSGNAGALFELQVLIKDQDFLECLEGCGVDNWCGYEEAQEQFHE